MLPRNSNGLLFVLIRLLSFSEVDSITYRNINPVSVPPKALLSNRLNNALIKGIFEEGIVLLKNSIANNVANSTTWKG